MYLTKWRVKLSFQTFLAVRAQTGVLGSLVRHTCVKFESDAVKTMAHGIQFVEGNSDMWLLRQQRWRVPCRGTRCGAVLSGFLPAAALCCNNGHFFESCNLISEPCEPFVFCLN